VGALLAGAGRAPRDEPLPPVAPPVVTLPFGGGEAGFVGRGRVVATPGG
jgi:hypothetical protein